MTAEKAAAPSTTENTKGNVGVKRPVFEPRERGPIVWSSTPKHETFYIKATTDTPPGYKRVSQVDERITNL